MGTWDRIDLKLFRKIILNRFPSLKVLLHFRFPRIG